MKIKYKKAIAFFIIIVFSNAAFADEIKLYKKGIRIKFDQDMHCMTNMTALHVLGKLKLCPETCQIKLASLSEQHKVASESLQKQMENQKTMYTDIVAQKNDTIDKIQSQAILAAADSGTAWWEITLYITGGVVLGAAVATGAIYLTK